MTKYTNNKWLLTTKHIYYWPSSNRRPSACDAACCVCCRYSATVSFPIEWMCSLYASYFSENTQYIWPNIKQTRHKQTSLYLWPIWRTFDIQSASKRMYCLIKVIPCNILTLLGPFQQTCRCAVICGIKLIVYSCRSWNYNEYTRIETIGYLCVTQLILSAFTLRSTFSAGHCTHFAVSCYHLFMSAKW